LALETPKVNYTGKVREITLGSGEKAITIGGETAYPFYTFEGKMPHKPRIALEVLDDAPEDWPAALTAVYGDVLSDPVKWAKKCVELGADAICLRLASIDPNSKNASAEDAVGTVKKVAEAISLPLIVWGCGSAAKDAEVLRKIAETIENKPLILGPVVDTNYKTIGAGAIGFGHTVVASTPIDVNLAKQLNILLEQLGVPEGKILVDPTTGALGYGLEYTYSVMERDRMAALTQGDDKLAYPILNMIGAEVWKVKEAKISAEDAPNMGNPEKRGILMEAATAMLCLMAGSDLLVLRHPESMKLLREVIDELVA